MLKQFFSLIHELFFPSLPEVKKLEQMTVEEYAERLPRAEKNKEHIEALWIYSHPLVKTAVWEIKYGKNVRIAERIGEILYAEITSQLEDYMLFENIKKILLIPIPSSRERYRERGYNQTELICEAIVSFDYGSVLEYKKNLLIRTKNTLPQTKTLNKKNREQNPIGSFGVKKPEEISKRTVILIDDVLTTGSTLKEAMKVIRKAGAKNVFSFTIAH